MSRLLRNRLQSDLEIALRQRDGARVSVLRTTLSALSNAEAVDVSDVAPTVTEVPRRELTDDDIRLVVERERDELRLTASRMRRVGADDRARELVAQARLLDGYLAGAARNADTASP